MKQVLEIIFADMSRGHADFYRETSEDEKRRESIILDVMLDGWQNHHDHIVFYSMAFAPYRIARQAMYDNHWEKA